MLDFIYYPVSGIMWVWHWLFDALLPSTPGWDGIAWALSVVFLVFTLRAILYKPFVKQIATTRKMQEIQPQMQAIRKKYAKDKVKMTEEMQKLQREHGFNPLLGCLPMLLQIPVFIGLFHVLRSFNRTATGMGQLGLSPEQTRNLPNYFFSVDQVQNFLDARLFGVPLSAFITEPVTEWQAFMSNPSTPVDFGRADIAVVVIPIMIVASFATFMNARASAGRMSAEALENPQTRFMTMLSQYVFPLGILVTGPFFPVAILLYWVSNNVWTYGQQHLVFGRIEKEEEAAKLAKQEKLKANAPKPGARPDRTKRASDSDEVVVADDAATVSLAKADKPAAGLSKLFAKSSKKTSDSGAGVVDAGAGESDVPAATRSEADGKSGTKTAVDGAAPSASKPNSSEPGKPKARPSGAKNRRKGSRKGGRH